MFYVGGINKQLHIHMAPTLKVESPIPHPMVRMGHNHEACYFLQL